MDIARREAILVDKGASHQHHPPSDTSHLWNRSESHKSLIEFLRPCPYQCIVSLSYRHLHYLIITCLQDQGYPQVTARQQQWSSGASLTSSEHLRGLSASQVSASGLCSSLVRWKSGSLLEANIITDWLRCWCGPLGSIFPPIFLTSASWDLLLVLSLSGMTSHPFLWTW